MKSCKEILVTVPGNGHFITNSSGSTYIRTEEESR